MNAHYVPQFYLKKFLDTTKGQLFVLEKKSLNIKMEPIKKICSEKDFFQIDGIEECAKGLGLEHIKDDRGIKITKDYFENELSKKESHISTILNLIISSNSFDQINKEELWYFLEWVAFLYIANPSTKSLLQQRDPLGSETSRNGGIISWHEKIKMVFLARTWGLAVSKKQLFTSDRPVVLHQKIQNPVDLIELGKTEIYFPLSPQHLLIGKPNNNLKFEALKLKEELPEQVSSFVNRLLYDNAEQKLLATRLEALNELKNMVNPSLKITLYNFH